MEVMVQYVTRSFMREIINERDRGIHVSDIAIDKHINYQTLLRYTRVYDRYGIEAFRNDDAEEAA